MHRTESRFYRRTLPHIIRADRPLFITWSTLGHWVLPPGARSLALRHILFDHGKKSFVYVVVVMPEHVHVILRLADDVHFSDLTKTIKGVSAHRINQLLGRMGNVWLDESFDHVVRNSEWSRRKIEYVCNNPVRRGLVTSPDEYRWLWRSWIEGGNRGWLDRLD